MSEVSGGALAAVMVTIADLAPVDVVLSEPLRA
jgi:hypothetical protein